MSPLRLSRSADLQRLIVLSNLHGGLDLGAVTALVLAAGVLVFTRRDLH
jgi:hypothetical protein